MFNFIEDIMGSIIYMLVVQRKQQGDYYILIQNSGLGVKAIMSYKDKDSVYHHVTKTFSPKVLFSLLEEVNLFLLPMKVEDIIKFENNTSIEIETSKFEMEGILLKEVDNLLEI